MAERTIAYVPLDELVPAPRNPKTHAAEELAASLDRFSFTEPLLLDERTGRLVAGHGRMEALRARQGRGEAPPEGVRSDEAGRWAVPVVRGWSSRDDAEAEAYLVASNRLTERGGWEQPELAELLSELAAGPGLDGLGYSTADLDELLAALTPPPAQHSDPDDVPEPPAEPVTERGDLWLLGPHRLLCGDATDPAAYDRVLTEHLAGAVVVTDPPYGVAIGAKNRALDAIDRADRVLTDLEGDQGIDEVRGLWEAFCGVLADLIPPGTPYYLFAPQGGDLGLLLLLLLRDAGLMPRHILIWVKNRPSFSIGRLDYDYQHEPIIYGWRPGAAHPWHADGPRTSVFFVDRPQASPDHPTAKPVELCAQLIANSTPPGGLVLDPFGGSGTTLIAAHQLGRVARLIEIDPRYCDVTVRRWEAHTGQQAVLAEG